jgi:hypothetical protein
LRFDGWFRLASHLKKTLNELMGWDGPMTHRQFAAWQWWLLEQWNQPDRHDHYLMSVAMGTDMSDGQKNLNDYKLQFNLPYAPSLQEAVEPVFLVDGKPFGPRRLTKEDVTRLEQQNLFARVAAVKPDRSKQTQAEMSRQIDEVIKHNEQAKRDGGKHRITPNGVKPSD